MQPLSTNKTPISQQETVMHNTKSL